MVNQIEQLLIKKFVIKEKHERYLGFISKSKTRNKFLDELYHFRDFNWRLFWEIPGSEHESNSILALLQTKSPISTCYVISVKSIWDQKVIPIEDAIKYVVGEEGTILIFGQAEIVYYEGEAPKNRYLSI